MSPWLRRGRTRQTRCRSRTPLPFFTLLPGEGRDVISPHAQLQHILFLLMQLKSLYSFSCSDLGPFSRCSGSFSCGLQLLFLSPGSHTAISCGFHRLLSQRFYFLTSFSILLIFSNRGSICCLTYSLEAHPKNRSDIKGTINKPFLILTPPFLTRVALWGFENKLSEPFLTYAVAIQKPSHTSSPLFHIS
jgi:hypothetical protein